VSGGHAARPGASRHVLRACRKTLPAASQTHSTLPSKGVAEPAGQSAHRSDEFVKPLIDHVPRGHKKVPFPPLPWTQAPRPGEKRRPGMHVHSAEPGSGAAELKGQGVHPLPAPWPSESKPLALYVLMGHG